MISEVFLVGGAVIRNALGNEAFLDQLGQAVLGTAVQHHVRVAVLAVQRDDHGQRATLGGLPGRQRNHPVGIDAAACGRDERTAQLVGQVATEGICARGGGDLRQAAPRVTISGAETTETAVGWGKVK